MCFSNYPWKEINFFGFLSNSTWTHTWIKCTKKSTARKMKYKMQVQLFIRFKSRKVTVKLLCKCPNMYFSHVSFSSCSLSAKSSAVCSPSSAGPWCGAGGAGGAAGKMSSSPAFKHWGRTMFTEGFVLHTY